MAMTACAANASSAAIWVSVNASTCSRPDHDRADRLALAQHRRRQRWCGCPDAPGTARTQSASHPPTRPPDPGCGSSAAPRSSAPRLTLGRSASSSTGFARSTRSGRGARPTEPGRSRPVDDGVVGAADPGRVPGDGVEHGVEIVGESAMARRISLVAVCRSSASVKLTVALLQLLEEAGVLDGDDGLVGERLQQRDLLVRERLDLEPLQHQHANRHAVAGPSVRPQ